MATTLVTLEVQAIVEESTEELLESYDGLIASDGLHIVNLRGRKLVVECVGSKITEILTYSDDDEVVLYNKKPEVSYYASTNKIFCLDDLIKIDGLGVYTIILTPKYSFLYNSEDTTSIELDNVKNIEQLKVYLEEHYSEYQVLRKIAN